MRPLEATVSLLTAALQRIHADAVADVLGWPGGCFVAVGVCIYIAATNLARNVSEWRDWNSRTRRVPLVNNCWLPLDRENSRIWIDSSRNSSPKLDPLSRGGKLERSSVASTAVGAAMFAPPLTHEHAAGRASEIGSTPERSSLD
jgi:hypothetical protein